MANVFLVVGVGGAGRGVCNHVKYELEQDFGSVHSAMTRILVIDGPPAPSQYALPAATYFEVDTSANSPEFCQTRDEANPATLIQRIAAMRTESDLGQLDERERAVAQWLSPEEANKVPTSTIQPEAGFGGHRTPGHVYFYLDINHINTALQTAYHAARDMLGEQSGQVITCLVGSQSGGTGAGMLWDVAHLIRQLSAPYNDVLLLFLPLANSYHRLFPTQSRRDEADAKNFAGLLNLIRLMNADAEFLSVQDYGPGFRIVTPNLFDVPFVLDGDTTSTKVNDVPPQRGVVPAIADLLLSCIKDNRTTGQMANVYTNWTNGIIGAAAKSERYATFGVCSVRYPYQEVLRSFSYKFAYEIYNDILNPTGENYNRGRTEADRLLTGTTFTQMLSDFDAVKLAPTDWRSMRSQVRVGKTGDAMAPSEVVPLTEEVKHGGHWFWKTPDTTVLQDAEQYSGNLKTQYENWLRKQQPHICSVFLSDVEEMLLGIFTKLQDGNRVPRTLQDDPSSVVVARDLLRHLKERLIAFEKHLADQFNAFYYPEGQGQPDLIAREQAAVDEKRDVMERDGGDIEESQEAYLVQATRLLECEIWQILFKGIQAITTELKQGVLRLWNLIGDDANGWVNRLTEFLAQMERDYNRDITIRTQFTEFRLRTYLPTPNGAAEEALFSQIGEEAIRYLLGQMHWEFALDPSNAKRRYTILLRSPNVDGFDYEKSGQPLIDPQTGRPIESYWYTPYEHVHYAQRRLADSLERQTIWDIMELDFEHEWWPAHRTQLEETQRGEYEDQYVREWVNRLVTCSDSLLNSTQQAQTVEAFTCSQFQQAASATNIGTKFSAVLASRLLPNENLASHADLSREIRRTVAYLQVPISSWNYYDTALANYVRQNQRNERILIDIYPNEQHAFHLRQLIVGHIDPNFRGLLDASVTALLYDLSAFQYATLAYVMGLIPSRKSDDITASSTFTIPISAGLVDVAETWDIDTLFLVLNRPATGPEDRADEIQAAVRDLWQTETNAALADGTLAELLTETEQRAESLTFPALPPDQTPVLHRDHLKLACRAAVWDYVQRVRAAQGMG